MSVNAWKTGVSGNWNDATKWSLEHVPTSSEDVTITAPGNYTVTVPTTASTPYYYSNSLTLGTNTTGTQKLAVNATLYINKAFNVGAGDAVDITNGRFLAYTPANSNCQVDGTITLNGVYGKAAYLSVGAANVIGTGSIVFATGGPDATYSNYLNGNDYTFGSGMTMRGKGGNLYGIFTNKGTIKLEGGATDVFYFGSLNNQGSFTAPGGMNVQIYDLTNAPGKTLSVTGGSLDLRGTYTNAGTISATNSKLFYGMTFTSAGVVNRVNTPVYFGGLLMGGGTSFKTGDAAGQWIWTGGTLQNGIYDPTAPNALKIDTSVPRTAVMACWIK